MMGRVYAAVARPLLIAGALIALDEPLEAQQAGDEASVRAVVSRFHAAVTAGNAAGAMAVVGPDAVFLEAGSVETRAQYEKDHLPADIGFVVFHTPTPAHSPSSAQAIQRLRNRARGSLVSLSSLSI